MVGAGFFGKVTSHGDFVGRRLAPSFQQPWDEWLQAGLRDSRRALGGRWLATWLNSPIWRFALSPGVCGPDGSCGVLMPSVDRVGRHFPLTVAAAWSGPPLDCVTQHAGWFAALENLALSSLRDDFSLDAFDAALCALPALPAAPRRPPAGTMIDLDGQQLTSPSAALMRAVAVAALDCHSLWWTDGSPQVAPCLLVCRGLPADYTALLDGELRG